MYEMIFLWILALVYIIFAVVQDIKTKEIANWISFSLIIFALGFRFFYALFQGEWFMFYNGLIGLGIFFIVGNLLYYGKIFAGGDAKLMIALGTILPYSSNFLLNVQGFFNFVLIFLFIGFFYIFVSSTFYCVKNFKSFRKEFVKQLKRNKKLMILVVSVSVLFLLFGFVERLSFVLGILTFFTSYLYLYSKAIDESCMVKKIKTSDLREGDWLYSNLKFGKRTINAKWEGVGKREIREIEEHYKNVKIRQGIAFSPVFLISFITFIIFIFLKMNLWDPFW